MYDIIIKNGTIVDGTGKDAFAGDIGIVGDTIAHVGSIEDTGNAKVIDAAGMTITPGFIDMHSHGDVTLLMRPGMESSIYQGITTIVGGQCGMSIAPLGDYWYTTYLDQEVIRRSMGKLLEFDWVVPLKDIKPHLEKTFGIKANWRSFGEYLDTVQQSGISGNYYPLVGINNIRAQVMGPDYARSVTPAELEEMKVLLRQSMEEGAFGASTGLDYAPCVFSSTEELTELARELAPFEGIYFTHWRRTGLRVGTPKRQKKIDGITEACEIGKAAGVQVQISHIMSGYEVFPSTDAATQLAGMRRTLEIVEEYRRAGLNVSADAIPNITLGLDMVTRLIMLLEEFIRPHLTVEEFVKRLGHVDVVKQIKDTINAGKYYVLNPQMTPEWDEYIHILRCADKTAEGKTLRELGEFRGQSSLDVMFDLILADPDTAIFRPYAGSTLEAVRACYEKPWCHVGIDTYNIDLEYPWADEGTCYLQANSNTYCGMLKYVTELGASRLEDTVHKITGASAKVLGLADRGTLEQGMKADIVVLDLAHVDTMENHIDPCVYPRGVREVLVNGVCALSDGVHTGARGGSVLRKR